GPPDSHLAELPGRLDAAYRSVAARLPENAALELIRDGERISLEWLTPSPSRPAWSSCAGWWAACCPLSTSRTRCWRCTPGPAVSTPIPTSLTPGPGWRTCRSRWPPC